MHENNDAGKQVLIIYDDLLDVVYKSDTISNLFVRGRHHNLSVIVILQTFFPKGSGLNLTATFKSNATHFLFTRNASMGELECISSKLEFNKECKKFFLNLFKKTVLAKRYGYLCVQLDVSNEFLKYMTNILFEDGSEFYTVHAR